MMHASEKHMLRYATLTVLMLALFTIGGCGPVLYLAGGRDHVEAQFKIPKKSRVLVFVDGHAGRDIPLEVPDMLAEQLNTHLYQYKAADSFVAVSRVADLRKDSLFADMSIADIARKVDADIVIYVDMINFMIVEQGGNQVNSGRAEVAVKVVDRNGKRLWPENSDANPLGNSVNAEIEEDMSDMRSSARVREDLLKRLTTRIGRLFHDWDATDRTIAK